MAAGLGLAFRLSARVGLCKAEDAERVAEHLGAVGLPSGRGILNRQFSAARLVVHMQRDKMRDGAMRFVLAQGIEQAFTSGDVAEGAMVELLRAEECRAYASWNNRTV